MNKRFWLALWGGLFILCAGLGFIPEPEGITAAVAGLAAALFFLPPAWLLWKKQEVALVRNLSALSLGLTLVLLVANFLSAFAPQWLGTALHAMLVVVSTPMIASGHWALSMFLWACLFFAALRQGK